MSNGNKRINKVTVIDPYFDEPDLVTVASYFGGLSTISLEIVSKFDAIKSELTKEERKSSLATKIVWSQSLLHFILYIKCII